MGWFANAVAIAKSTINGKPNQYLLIDPATGALIVAGSVSPTPASSFSTIADVMPPHGLFASPIVGVATPAVQGVQLNADVGNADYILITASPSIVLGGIRLVGGMGLFVQIDNAAKIYCWSPSDLQKLEVLVV